MNKLLANVQMVIKNSWGVANKPIEGIIKPWIIITMGVYLKTLFLKLAIFLKNTNVSSSVSNLTYDLLFYIKQVKNHVAKRFS